MPTLLSSARRLLAGLGLRSKHKTASAPPNAAVPYVATGALGLPEPIDIRVLMLVHDPVLHTRGGRKLSAAFGWNDSQHLADGYIQDLRECSHGYARYSIVERVDIDGLPIKADGFRYDERSYLAAWQNGRFHQPDQVDYLALLREQSVIERLNGDEIDEAWLFGPPYAGYYESIMGGPSAFWCNAPPLIGTQRCTRRFVVMGFNYERGVGEMLENFGHRTEAIMSQVFAGTRGEGNLFGRFTRYDLTTPGRAECGDVHFAPNSDADYDWGNRRSVPSNCDAWDGFPNLVYQPRLVNCAEWGNGDIRAHHRWWLRHLPHVEGAASGIAWNWWLYLVNPQVVGQAMPATRGARVP